MDHTIWIPLLGWQKIDRHLRRRLETAFSVPMIVIALMILPLLAVEFGEWEWARAVRSHWGVMLGLNIGTAVIWFAFAVEFIVMVSVAENKLVYCARHWLDLAIILLPLIAFLRVTRILRLGRVAQQMSRITRLYRMRGLSLRLWRALLLLNVFQRFIGQSPERQLRRLEDMLAEKEEEIQELRDEIARLRVDVAKRREIPAEVTTRADSSQAPTAIETPQAGEASSGARRVN